MTQKGQKRERKDHSSSHDKNKQRGNKIQKMVNFTPFVMPIDQVLMQIKDDHQLRWPKPLSNSPKARNKKKYCHFHHDHGHYMDECKDLKEQIEELIQRENCRSSLRKTCMDSQSKRFGPYWKTSLKMTTSHKNDRSVP